MFSPPDPEMLTVCRWKMSGGNEHGRLYGETISGRLDSVARFYGRIVKREPWTALDPQQKGILSKWDY